MTVVLTTVAAALLGALGPQVIRRLPEPDEPEAGKPLYADIARPGWLPFALAGFAGALAAVAAWAIDRPALMPAWVAVCAGGAWLSYIDARTHLLPKKLTDPLFVAVLALVGVGALVSWDWRPLAHAAIGAVSVWLVFRLIYELGRLVRGGGFGYGDVRLASILGLALGPLGVTATTVGLYAGLVLGVVVALPLMLLGVIGRKQHLAHGPYLVLGAVVGAVWPTLVG